MMTTKSKRLLIAGAAIAAVAGGGTGVAVATGGDDGRGKPITGTPLKKASRAALAQTGGGRVTATEVGDEEGYYEVEVTRDDGSRVDLHLDRNFDVLGGKADENGSGHD
jgi:uncharacterized membrane protein YkoI